MRYYGRVAYAVCSTGLKIQGVEVRHLSRPPGEIGVMVAQKSVELFESDRNRYFTPNAEVIQRLVCETDNFVTVVQFYPLAPKGYWRGENRQKIVSQTSGECYTQPSQYPIFTPVGSIG